MSSWSYLGIFLTLFILICTFNISVCINHHIDFYETLNYRPVLDRRKRRSLDGGEDGFGASTDLRFRSHNKTFHLKLLPIDRYSDVFAHDFIVDVDGENIFDGLELHEFLVKGYLKGDPTSRVYGSLIDGVFDGHIVLSDGHSFTVEKAAKYFDVSEKPSDFHSIIYHDSAINHKNYYVPGKRTKRANEADNPATGCGVTEELQRRMKSIQDSAIKPNNHHYQSYSYLYDEHYNNHTGPIPFPFRYGNERFRRQVRYKNVIQEVNGKRIYPVRTCTMYLQADHKLYESVFNKEGNRNHIRTREEIAALFYNHIKAVNQIYESTDFGGIRGLNFVIQRTSIYTKDTCHQGKAASGSDNPFCEDNVDVSNYLNLNSQRNHSAFCLAYALTFRDFLGGTLGLAWVASPTYNTAGGICQVYQKYNEGQHGTGYRSLNTGIVTLVNYGNRVPLRVSQLTMAHEIGHNFGSPHDQTADCQPGLPDGNYIMFASATSGDKVNNAKFSKCSITSISQVLYEVLQQPPVDSVMTMYGKKRNCFQERTSSFCGNQIREPGEQCDCGFTQQDCDEMGDRCCSPRENHQNSCRRTPMAACSPSEGLCCDASRCNFYLAKENQLCREESECLHSQVCDGRGAACPDSRPKADGLPCQDVTKVCHAGSCNGSICAEVGLKDCFLTEGKPDRLCHLACEKNGTCYSSFDLSEFSSGRFHQMNRENMPGLLLHPGSPCNNYKGYCDILRKCRSVDSNGPLARLKNLLFNKHTIKTVSQWIQEHWWACVIIGIGVLLFMATFVKCCAVHTPSTNPNKIPAQHFADTLRHPGTLLRRGRQAPHRGPAAYSDTAPTSTSIPINGVVSISNGNVRERPPTGHHHAHRLRQQQHQKKRLQNNQRQDRHSSVQQTSTGGHSSGNRAPPNLSTPPLIPPPPSVSAAALLVSPSQAFSPMHDPPPPYTPTDPASTISPAATSQSPPHQPVSSSNEVTNRESVALIGGLPTAPSVPAAVSLPSAPLPPPPTSQVPSVPGPPLPGQGPKPGRRPNRKNQLEPQKKLRGSTPRGDGSISNSASCNSNQANNRPKKRVVK